MNTIRQILTTKEVRRKLEWMFFIVFITRLVAMIPVPGIDSSVFQQWMAAQKNDALNLISSFTGGSFEKFSMFSLGITPLITAQIIIQMLAIAITPLERLKKKGEYGENKLKKYTNITAIVLAVIQSVCMAIGFEKSGMITSENIILSIILVTVSMTAGTGIMIWFSEILTKKSIGNGASVLLMVNIISIMPANFMEMIQDITMDKSKLTAGISVAVMALVVVVCMFIIIYMTEGYHPIHIQYSQKMSRSGEDADTGIIPVKVNISGVMPIIFATSIMSVPQFIAMAVGKGYGSGYSKIFLNMLNQANWFNGEEEIYSFGLLIYLALIIFIAFFYPTISFNGAEIANKIREQGGFIPGVRAGKDTEFYITKISRRLTSIGVVMLICATVVPIAICGEAGIQAKVSGSSLIIVAGVITETLQQIRLEVAGRQYSGLLSR